MMRASLGAPRQPAPFNSLINLFGFLDRYTFVTKTGELGVVLAVDGVDDECLDADARHRIARQFEAALRHLDPQTRLLQYVIKRPRLMNPPEPSDEAGVNTLLEREFAFQSQESPALYAFVLYWVIVTSPVPHARAWMERIRQGFADPRTACRDWLSRRRTVVRLDDDLERLRRRLYDQVQAFGAQLADTVHPMPASKWRAFRFFRRLVNYDPEKAEALDLREDTFLDYHLCDSALECHRGHLRLDDAYVRVLTLKEPPRETFAQVLGALAHVPSSLVVMSDWQRADTGAVRRELHAKRRHFHNSKTSLMNYLGDAPTVPGEVLIDEGAAGLVRDLGACLADLTLQGRFVGFYSLTVILYDDDPEVLAHSVAACIKVCAAHDAQLTDERANLLNAWLAALPGNSSYNLRRMYVLNTNCADLGWLFAPNRGSATNTHLGLEALATLPTLQRTPYHLNLHVHDVAHTLVLGATGSGKSFLLNFLVAHLQRYAPRTLIFDLGGSYRGLTEYFGGSAQQVERDRCSFTINPFCLPSTPANRQFVWAFVKVLIQSANQYTMTEIDDRDLFEQIDTVYALDPDQRRLFTLATILRRPLSQRLQRWVQGGQYGDVFDHADDTFTLARLQYLDFEGLERVPQVLEPLLFYVLHRADAAMAADAVGNALTVFVIDEAWRFLRDPTIRVYLAGALKTWRKRNACVLLATQSSDDLTRSELFRVIVESCPTTCFLANPQIDRQAYQELFHLTATEADRIATLIPRQQFLWKRPEVAKVLTLRVPPEHAELFSGGGSRPRVVSEEGASA